MRQTRLGSFIEACGGTALGFGIALVIQRAVDWWFALPLRRGDDLTIVALFTAASFARTYLWRRCCERLALGRRREDETPLAADRMRGPR